MGALRPDLTLTLTPTLTLTLTQALTLPLGEQWALIVSISHTIADGYTYYQAN